MHYRHMSECTAFPCQDGGGSAAACTQGVMIFLSPLIPIHYAVCGGAVQNRQRGAFVQSARAPVSGTLHQSTCATAGHRTQYEALSSRNQWLVGASSRKEDQW